MPSEDRGGRVGVESSGNGLSPAAVRAQLERVIADALFSRSDRLTRFLSFIVEETLEGRQNGLKEYQVGISVCDRAESYDPRTDPVVRVEARRLRSALDTYYANGGRQDPLLISLPKGGYVPSFAPRQVVPPEERDQAPGHKSKTRRWVLAALAGGAVFVSAVVALWRLPSKPVLTDKDTIVVADFENATGDSVFDGTLRHGLAAQLEQSPFLNLLSDSRVAQTVALMAKDKNARLTADAARQVCARTGSTATIEGSISKLGGQYVLDIEAVNCHNGNVLAQEQVTANSKEHVLTALAAAAAQLRRKLGESLASVEKFDAPPENVTTPSLEALQAYSIGFNVHVVDLDEARAAELFRRAITIDPSFAMAYARLATCYMNLGEPSRAADSMRKAYELRERVSEHEKLFITSQYERYVTGDLQAARKTYQLRAELYPHDDIPIGNLGNVYFTLGEYDKAVAATEEALRRNPSSRIWHGNMVASYVAANRLQDAKAIAQEAIRRDLDSSWLHIWLYLIGFLQHDDQAMRREAASLRNQPGFEDVLLYYQSQVAAYRGRLAESRELTRQAVESAKRNGQKDSAAIYMAEEGVREALVGNNGRAKQQAQMSLALSRSRDSQAVAALALAIARDRAAATRFADELLKRFPEDTLVQLVYVPMIRAAIALQENRRGGSEAAITTLATTAPYELGSRAMIRLGLLSCYPVYLRGKAYLAAGNGALAASEFEKIIDNPQLTMTDPIGVITYRELARAYALSGDHGRSASANEKFLALWRNADPDIPLLHTGPAVHRSAR